MHMKKPTIANLMESIGMLGIMGSLIFVGIEVSQNSSIARTASYQSYIDGFTDLNLAQISDDDLKSLMVRASTGTSKSEFTPEEIRKSTFFTLHCCDSGRVYTGL